MCCELLCGRYSCGVRRLRWLERYREFCGIGVDQREEGDEVFSEGWEG